MSETMRIQLTHNALTKFFDSLEPEAKIEVKSAIMKSVLKNIAKEKFTLSVSDEEYEMIREYFETNYLEPGEFYSSHPKLQERVKKRIRQSIHDDVIHPMKTELKEKYGTDIEERIAEAEEYLKAKIDNEVERLKDVTDREITKRMSKELGTYVNQKIQEGIDQAFKQREQEQK